MKLLSSKQNILILLGILSKSTRYFLILLLGIMLLGAILEVVSIGAVIPFLAAIYDPTLLLKNPLFLQIKNTLGINIELDIRLYLTIFFIFTSFLAAAIRISIVYFSAKFNAKVGHELTVDVYRRSINQPYEVHLLRNSSEVLGGLSKVEQVTAVVNALMLAISSFLIALFIVVTLLYISPIEASIGMLGFGIIYTVISINSRKRLAADSVVTGKAVNGRIKITQESLGGIRDIILDHSQPYFIENFSLKDSAYRIAKANIDFIAQSPRFIIEAIGMVVIAYLGYSLTKTSQGIATSIPILGAITLGAQRIMPPIQQIYNGWVTIVSNRNALNEVRELLQQPIESGSQSNLVSLPFNHNIQLCNVSFNYSQSTLKTLDQINLTIKKGERIGLIGETGSGKSTLVDLIMGLFLPSSGEMLVDGVKIEGDSQLDWKKNITHVPQNIYLVDTTFAENIAFGIELDKIDLQRMRVAAQQAQIAKFIESTQEGYEGLIGERGLRLSGGQRQRIGIARALYKKGILLVLDEATSALDGDTEAKVMRELSNLGSDMTFLVVAHRLTTLSFCDSIYKIDKGRIVWSGSYSDLMGDEKIKSDIESRDLAKRDDSKC